MNLCQPALGWFFETQCRYDFRPKDWCVLARMVSFHSRLATAAHHSSCTGWVKKVTPLRLWHKFLLVAVFHRQNLLSCLSFISLSMYQFWTTYLNISDGTYVWILTAYYWEKFGWESLTIGQDIKNFFFWGGVLFLTHPVYIDLCNMHMATATYTGCECHRGEPHARAQL